MASTRKKLPCKGMTMVASHFNGWYNESKGMRAFRYATSNPYRVPTARYSISTRIPAIEMAGYPYQMPTASSNAINLIYGELVEPL